MKRALDGGRNSADKVCLGLQYLCCKRIWGILDTGQAYTAVCSLHEAVVLAKRFAADTDSSQK